MDQTSGFLVSSVAENGDTAILSGCERYRYSLTRILSDQPLKILWIMLNPSKADAFTNDPTILACMEFSRRWGYGQMTVVNRFAFRATDPQELKTAADPYGPLNEVHILRGAEGADRIICAWGQHELVGWYPLPPLPGGIKAECLIRNKDGSPRHPLYIRRDTKPIPFQI